MKWTPFLACVALLAMPALSGCATVTHPPVMTSFYPLEFIAKRLAGHDLEVGVVVRPGVEPHDYEPTTTDMERLAEAQIVITLGAHFEAWIDRAHAASAATFVTATEGMALSDNPDPDEAQSLPQDPHIWLDPVLFSRVVGKVADAMAERFPAHAQAIRSRAATLQDDLATLDLEFRTGLAHCQVPFIVTGHAAFSYLAARYNFTMIAIAGLDPESEPSPQALSDVVEQVRAHHVPVVFFEDLVDPKVAQAVAREAGVPTRVLSPIEGILPSDTQSDYLSKMRDDLTALKEGMVCQ